MLGSIPILMAASAMQMVLVLGATSKVGELLQYAQQIVSESVQNSRTVQASGIERTLTDLYASMVKTAAQSVFTCALGGCAQGVATSVHFFVMAGDIWYASVLVDNGNASFAGVMQAFLGGPVQKSVCHWFLSRSHRETRHGANPPNLPTF